MKSEHEPIPITAAVSEWHGYIRRFTERTQGLYKFVLQCFCSTLPEVTNIEQITTHQIQAHIDYLHNKGLKNRTINAHLAAIKSFCRWFSDNYELDNPATKIKMLKEDPPKRRFLDPKEYEKVLKVCSNDEAKIIQLLAHTGLRAAELQALQLENISHDLKSIRFTGKGRKERIVPLNKITRQCITVDGKPNLDFLESYRYRNALYALCKRLSFEAGLDSIANPHSFRRFFGNSLIKKNVSIYYVSKIYGHSDIRTTEMYLNCNDDDLIGVTEILCE